MRLLLRALILLALLSPLLMPSLGEAQGVPSNLDPTQGPLMTRATGAYPALDPIVIPPASQGGFTVFILLASNKGTADFSGDLHAQIPEFGIDVRVPFPIPLGSVEFEVVPVDVPMDAPDLVHVRLAFDENGTEVGHGEERTFQVVPANTDPCQGAVGIVRSSGAKAALVGDAARYAYVACNGSNTTQTFDVSFHDATTQRPLWTHEEAIAFFANATNGAIVTDTVDPYHFTLPPHGIESFLFSIDDAPPPSQIKPIAELRINNGTPSQQSGLDPVTFAPPAFG